MEIYLVAAEQWWPLQCSVSWGKQWFLFKHKDSQGLFVITYCCIYRIHLPYRNTYIIIIIILRKSRPPFTSCSVNSAGWQTNKKCWESLLVDLLKNLMNLCSLIKKTTTRRQESPNWCYIVITFIGWLSKVAFISGLYVDGCSRASKHFLMSESVHPSIAGLPGRAWNAAVGFNRLFG